MPEPKGIELVDFTGGLHLRRNEFQLADNQSPEMVNIDVDPRGGFGTRKGWTRFNAADIVATPSAVNWVPKNAFIQSLTDGSYNVYIANDDTIYAAPSSGVFADLAIPCGASPHLADFATWGDVCYFATGKDLASYKRDGVAAAASVPRPGSGTYNDDYTVPAGGRFPQANCIATHMGYMFAAGIEEDYDGGGVADYPNRLRWSHPNEPEDWATLDKIDIEGGGDRITALCSFGNRLLIFKPNSVWALYGYSAESWNLEELSRVTGTPSPVGVTTSDTAVYFYSGGQRSGVYGYSGQEEPVNLSDALERAISNITDHNHACLAWLGRRLWCALPWDFENGASGHSIFVFDPDTNGAWTCYQPALGTMHVLIERSDVVADKAMGVIDGDSGAAAALIFDQNELAVDEILAGAAETAFSAYYRTGWKYGDASELQKGWMRPRYIVSRSPSEVSVNVEVYWNYDGASVRRQDVIVIPREEVSLWDALGSGGDGFEWGDGTLWSQGTTGSIVTRAYNGRSLGWARAISLEFSTAIGSEGIPWVVSGIILKYHPRRFTT